MKTATSTQTYDVIIIGAGPAGLCLGNILKERGMKSFCLIDKGRAPGESWDLMPEWLRLITYWQDNYLRSQDNAKFSSFQQVYAPDFASYLREISQGLEIYTECSVSEVQKESDLFRVKTSFGVLTAKAVVMCVGYYSNPFMLEKDILREATIPIRHFADMKGMKFEPHKRYLVVGRALSAGQAAEQIHEAMAFFDLSTRGELKFGAGPAVQRFFLRHLARIERTLISIAPHKSSKVPMEKSVKRIIKNAQAQVRPPIAKVQGKTVHFTDGTQTDYEGIILATGFRYAGAKILKGLYKEDSHLAVELTQLIKGFEAPLVPKLYFLGVDNQVDFTSRYLRGIRRDAGALAKLLQTQ